MTFDCIVVASHLRFDGVYQRPHHIVARLAQHVPLLFVEEPLLSDLVSDEVRAVGGVGVLRSTRRTLGPVPLDPRTVEAVRGWVGTRRPLIWLYTPMMLELADAYCDAPLVFDCMDELSAFAFAPPDLHERESALLRRADLVFTGGSSLYERRRGLGERVKLYPSGVEFEHFASAPARAPHPLLTALARPVCGYVGVIDERMDFACVAALAKRPVSVVLVGPTMKIDPRVLPQRTNVHFTGQMPYPVLPSLLAGFDVALMPFALSAATAYISPTKTPEYLAAGLPVVSTPIADVVASYGDVVRIAAGPEAFAAAALAAAQPDPARIAAGIARARAAGWDAIVACMWGDLRRE